MLSAYGESSMDMCTFLFIMMTSGASLCSSFQNRPCFLRGSPLLLSTPGQLLQHWSPVTENSMTPKSTKQFLGITCEGARGRRKRTSFAKAISAKIGFDVYQFEGLVDPDVGFFWTSRVLGATLVSFIATFTIAPQFSSEFKESEDWTRIYDDLIDKKTKSVEPESACKKMEAGAVLLDVSMETCPKTIDGSVRIPLYQPIDGWSVPKILRRAGFAAFGVDGTERNPNWLQDVKEAIPEGKEVYVIDKAGGSLESKIGMKHGTQSRSLKAVHFLQTEGYTKVSHVKGGLMEWERRDLPLQTQEQSSFTWPF